MTPTHDSPADSRKTPAPRLEPAATPPRPSWQRRLVVALAGVLAALGFGAGFGAYSALLGRGGHGHSHTVVRNVVVTPPTAAPAAAEPPPLRSPIDLAFVAHANRPWALLDLGFDPAWVRGEARALPPGDDDFIAMVTRDVDVAAIPEEALDALGTELTLYGEDGEVCRARVARIAALGRYADGGFLGDEIDHWQKAEGSYALAAELLPVSGTCAEARWARSSALPAPEIAEVVPAPDALEAQAVDAFRRRDEYRAIQRAFEDAGESGHWDEFAGGQIDVKLVRGSGTSIVVAEAVIGGCGTFEDRLVLLWRLDEGGELVPVSLDAELAPLGIDSAADLDFDGTPELFYQPDSLGDAVLRASETGYREAEAFEVPYYGCRC